MEGGKEEKEKEHEKTIFFSWQSDTGDTGLLRSAIQSAVESLNTRPTGPCTYRFDEATRGMPGSPNIVHAVLGKIDNCSIFIADVTIINKKGTSRRTPNPNVLYELGYAMKCIGPERVIMLFDTGCGNLSDLPFDIAQCRVATFAFKKSTLRQARKVLTSLQKDQSTRSDFSEEELEKLDANCGSLLACLQSHDDRDTIMCEVEAELVKYVAAIEQGTVVTHWERLQKTIEQQGTQLSDLQAASDNEAITQQWNTAYMWAEKFEDDAYYGELAQALMAWLLECEVDMVQQGLLRKVPRPECLARLVPEQKATYAKMLDAFINWAQSASVIKA